MQVKFGRKIRTFSLARKTNILTFKKKECMHRVHYMHASTQYTAPVYGRVHGFETFSSTYFSFFLFLFLCLFVCLFYFVFVFFVFWGCFFCSFFFPSFFSAFRCLSTGRGLVPMLSFPKNAGIVKLLMPSETGRRPRSSMLSSAGNN